MNSIKTNDRSNQDTFIFIYSFGDLNQMNMFINKVLTMKRGLSQPLEKRMNKQPYFFSEL